MADDYLSIKQNLHDQCKQYVSQRINNARQAMEEAQESANSESKSSAGDKYETGRAMAQLERDRHAQLLVEAKKLEQEITRLNIDKQYETVQPGSLVMTSRGGFFISISAGKLTIQGVDYFAISPNAPISAALAGHQAGDTIPFNKTAYQILKVV